MARAERVALGLRAHSGWAVLVALSGPVSEPHVVDRRRLELCDDSFPHQPYHAAAELARAAVLAAVERRREDGQHVAGAGLLLSSSRPLPGELARVRASHALIHGAEGEMYRDVLRDGCMAVQSRLAALGKPLGPPWTQDEKLASLAAWLVLRGGAS
jgi:hypothetical protein